MYAYAYGEDECGMRAKGVQKSVLRQTINMDDYRHCLFEEEACSRAMTGLRSHDHHTFGERTVKTALSPFDSKRYIRDDGTHTLAYGHYCIQPSS